jgi:hypothetical protein
MTIVAYVVTLALAALAVTAIPVALVGGVLGRGLGLRVGGLFAGILTWTGVNFLWHWLEGGSVPMAALAGSLVGLAIQESMISRELNPHAKVLLAAEMWAIVLVGLGLAVLATPVRWY